MPTIIKVKNRKMKHSWEVGKWQRDMNMHGNDTIYRIDICKRGCGYERKVVLNGDRVLYEYIESYSNENSASLNAPSCEKKPEI